VLGFPWPRDFQKVRFPKERTVAAELSEFCVYTIRHKDWLEKAIAGGVGEGDEKKQWVTAGRLFGDRGQCAMAILFGDASDCEKLICWAILTQIQYNNEGTSYSFENAKRLRGRKTQQLRLRSSRNMIAPNFIKPYAICYTPDFLLG
jgi:hypothetical protein